MATGNTNVTKIYELRTLGYDDLIKQLGSVNKAFADIQKAKAALAKEKATTPQDSAEWAEINKQLEQAKIKTLALKIEKQNLTNEMKASQNVRQAEINQQKAVISGNNAQAGSYRALQKEIRELGNAVRNVPKGSNVSFGGGSISYDSAINRLKELMAAEQTFRRQFQKDGTLVGEYTTGINNSFNSLHNVGGNVTKKLSEGFRDMRKEVASFLLTFVGIQSAFQFIEKGLQKFEETEKSAIRLEQVVKNLGKEGDFGALNKNLDDLKAKFTYLSIFDLREATQRLVTYGKLSSEQIKEITGLAVNLAAQQGKSVSDVTEVLLKGLAGQGRGLLDFGIKIKDARTEQERFALITTEVGRRVQGQAEAFQKSGSSSIETYKKQLEQLSVDIGQKLLPFLSAFSVLLGVITANFPLLIGVTLSYVVGLALANSQLIIARAQMIGLNIIMPILTVLTGSQAAATMFLADATIFLNIQKTRLLKLLQSPIFKYGVLAIAALGVAMSVYAVTVNRAAKALTGAANQQKFANEATKEAEKAIAGQMVKEKILLSIIKDNTAAYKTRESALQDLTTQMGKYGEGLKLENILTEKGTKALKAYNTELFQKADAMARVNIAERQANKLTDAVIKSKDIQKAILTGGSVKSTDLDEEDIAELNKRRKTDVLGVNIGGANAFNKNNPGFLAAANNLGGAIAKAMGAVSEYTSKQDLKILDDIYKDKIKVLGKDADDAAKNVIKKADNTNENLTPAKIQSQIDEINKHISEVLDISDPRRKLLEVQRDRLQAVLDKLEGKKHKDKKSTVVRDHLSEIESALKQELAIEEKRIIEIKKKRELSFEEEIEYAKNTEAINIKFINQKIKYLEGKKHLEVTEKAELATFRKEIADLELKGLKDIEAINKKEFEKSLNILKEQLDERIAVININKKNNDLDNSISPLDKAQFELNADKKILDLQEAFNKKTEELEKRLLQDSLKAAKERADGIRKINEQLYLDSIKLKQAELENAKNSGDKNISSFQKIIADARNRIDQSKGSESSKERKHAQLDKDEEQGLIAREVASLKVQLPLYKKLLDAKIITDLEYEKIEIELAQKEKVLHDSLENSLTKTFSLAGLVKDKLKDVFRIKTGSDEDNFLGQALSESYSLAQDAMNSYFNAEENRIQNSLKLAEARLDVERNQLRNKATSKAEEASIDAQFEAKKAAANKKAGEDLKKTKKAEAKIALLTELANIAVTSAQNPANGITFGTAGLIEYGILSALALGRYALNVSSINAQKFEEGGSVPSSGGVFGGNTHANGGTPFSYGGGNYEAERGELAIIRTRNANPKQLLSLMGTQQQIASQLNQFGGGKPFAMGGHIKKFADGGYIGDSLQAPRLPFGYFDRVSGTSEILNSMTEQARAMQLHAQAMEQRVDRIEVVQVTSSVNNAIRKSVKQNSIGTL